MPQNVHVLHAIHVIYRDTAASRWSPPIPKKESRKKTQVVHRDTPLWIYESGIIKFLKGVFPYEFS